MNTMNILIIKYVQRREVINKYGTKNQNMQYMNTKKIEKKCMTFFIALQYQSISISINKYQ